jgi:hypothetical protein
VTHRWFVRHLCLTGVSSNKCGGGVRVRVRGGGRGAIAGRVVLECNSVDAGARVLGEAASLLTL